MRLASTDAIQNVGKADLLRLQTSLQGTLVHRQLLGDGGQAAVAISQLSSDKFFYLLDKIKRIASNQVSYKAFDGNANMWISAIQHLLEERFWNNHAVTRLLARYFTFKNFTVTGKRHTGRMRKQHLPIGTHIPSKHAQGLDQ